METGSPLPAPVAAPEPRRWVYRASSALISVLFVFLAVLAIGQNAVVGEPMSGNDLRIMAALLLSLPLAAAIWVRDRVPFLVPLIGAGIAIALPGAPLISAIALGSLLHRRRGIAVILTTVAVAVAQLVGAIRDRGAPVSLLRDTFPQSTAGAVTSVVFAVLIPMGIAIGYGLIRSAYRDRGIAVTTTRNVVARSQVLYDEVTRQHERSELARELHDTVAARLSVISLNAGALGLAASAEEPQKREAYDRIQLAAQSAVTDLRGMIGDLRSPGQHGAPASSTESLAHLTDLIDEAHAAGESIRSSILVGDLETCSPEVSHVCYRLIQESLSNARRHAPNAPVRLSLRGGPETGLSLEVVSSAATAPPGAEGHTGGLGLVGMDERTAGLGGWFSAGALPDGTFRVQAWLPWSPTGESAVNAAHSR